MMALVLLVQVGEIGVLGWVSQRANRFCFHPLIERLLELNLLDPSDLAVFVVRPL